MTLLPYVLRRAVGIACIMITASAWAAETWDTFASGTGVNGPVRAMTTFGGDLIVGGQFDTAGGLATPGIARWNGSTWSALGGGMPNSVLALTTFNGELIAGGLFTSASGAANTTYIARWNGSSWSSLGTGMNGEVYALAVFNNELYAGGAFTNAGGTAVNRIAKWNGSAWSKVRSGMNDSVHALTTFNGELIAGGAFTKADNKSANRMARWNGSAWSKLGSAMSSPSVVYALATCNGALYAGGQFPTAGGVAGTSGIARWNGSTWSALGSGLNNTVKSLASFDDLSGNGAELYVGGYFTAPIGYAPNSTVQIARWNDVTGWSAVGSGMVETPSGGDPRGVFALAPSLAGDLLWAGGFCEVYPETAGIAGYLMGYHFVP